MITLRESWLLRDTCLRIARYSVMSTLLLTKHLRMHSIESERQQRGHLPPAFVMIDPFGVSGVPMNTIGRILETQNQKSLSPSWRDINRFKQHNNFESHLDEPVLIGERASTLTTARSRIEFFYRPDTDQLKKRGEVRIALELYEVNNFDFLCHQ